MKIQFLTTAFLLMAATLIGCSKSADTTSVEPSADDTAVAAVDGSMFILSTEPDGAGDVIGVRAAAGDGEDVVLVGRIGGSSDPWIAGRAAFSIVDESLKACSDIPGDGCPKPWDYCCETPKLPAAMALVKVVDQEGELVKADAKELLGVQELSTVVVQGKAKRDDAGNLTVLASGIFVKQK